MSEISVVYSVFLTWNLDTKTTLCWSHHSINRWKSWEIRFHLDGILGGDVHVILKPLQLLRSNDTFGCGTHDATNFDDKTPRIAQIAQRYDWAAVDNEECAMLEDHWWRRKCFGGLVDTKYDLWPTSTRTAGSMASDHGETESVFEMFEGRRTDAILRP